MLSWMSFLRKLEILSTTSIYQISKVDKANQEQASAYSQELTLRNLMKKLVALTSASSLAYMALTPQRIKENRHVSVKIVQLGRDQRKEQTKVRIKM